MDKAKAVEKVLRAFWRGESPNGAYHGCAIATNANQKRYHSAHHRMTVEEARDKIVEIFVGKGVDKKNDRKKNK